MAIGNFLATGSDSDRELLEQGRRMIAARGTWDAHVTDLVRNFMPSRSVTTEALRGGTPMTPGNKTMQYIVNSTPVWAADMGAAALFSFVTTPSTYWFIARAQQEHLNMNPEIREWLFGVRNFVFNVLTSNTARFYAQVDPFYHEFLVLGTGVTFGEPKPQYYRTRFRPIFEFYPLENDDGVIDRTFRKYFMTRSNAKRVLGENVLYNEGDGEADLEFLQYIGPRDDGRVQSIHWYKDTIVRRGFFEDFPCAFARYQREYPEVQGRGPGMVSLGDAKMLQEMEKSLLRAQKKRTDPPIVTTGKIRPNLRADPGTFINVQGGLIGKSVMQTLPPGDTGTGEKSVERIEARIERMFGVDMFLQLVMRGNASPLKATEAMGRREEAFRARSSVYLALAQDWLSPQCWRVYGLGRRRGLIPPPPLPLRASSGWFGFEFSSPVAIAQRRTEVDNYLGWLNGMLPLMQVAPDSAKVPDAEYAMRKHALLYDLDPGYLKAPAVLEQERQLAAQTEAMQALAPTLKDAGQAAKAFADAGAPIQ